MLNYDRSLRQYGSSLRQIINKSGRRRLTVYFYNITIKLAHAAVSDTMILKFSGNKNTLLAAAVKF